MTTSDEKQIIFSRPFLLAILTQGTFALAWTTFLLTPKFLETQLGATPAQIGQVSGLSNLGAAVMAPLIALYIDRIPRRPAVILGCFIFAFQAFIHSSVDSFGPTVYILQILIAIAFTLVFNANGALVSEIVPANKLTYCIGLLGATNIIMNAIGPPITEALVPYIGWSGVFIYSGLLVFAAVFAVSNIKTASTEQKMTEKPDLVKAAKILNVPIIASILVGIGFGSMFVFFQPYALSQGAENVAMFYVGFTIGGILIRVGPIHYLNEVDKAQVSIIALLAYSVAVICMSGLTPSTLVFFGFIFGIVHGVMYPMLSTFAIERGPSHLRGCALTFVNGGFCLGVAICSWIFGPAVEIIGYAWSYIGLGISIIVLTLVLAKSIGNATVEQEIEPEVI